MSGLVLEQNAGRPVFVDTETTGLDPERHEIWEVGLITSDQDGVPQEHLWHLPVDQFDRHSALGDARWARAIYDEVLGL